MSRHEAPYNAKYNLKDYITVKCHLKFSFQYAHAQLLCTYYQCQSL